MSIENISQNFDKWDAFAVKFLSSSSGAAIFGSFGYVGHLLVSGQELTKRKIIGGVMLSTFTGVSAYYLSKAIGVSDAFCVFLSVVTGSLCETGYTLLAERAKQLLKEKDE